MDIEIGSLTLEKKHFFFEIDIENLNKNINYIAPIKLFEEKKCANLDRTSRRLKNPRRSIWTKFEQIVGRHFA